MKRRRTPVTPRLGLAVALVLALVAAGCSGSSTSSDRSATTAAGAGGAAATSPPASASVSTGLTVSIAAPGSLDVAVTVPSGATEMEVGTDATFATATWVPVAPKVTVAVADTGYQMLFARFRDGAKAAVGTVLVGGATNDPTLAAATASAGGGPHQASEIGLVAPNVIAITVESGRVNLGRVEPYDFAHPAAGDKVVAGNEDRKIVRRNDDIWAEQVNPGVNLVKILDTVAGTPLDAAHLDDAKGYKVTSPDDAAYAKALAPMSVTRITRPTALAKTKVGDQMTVSHQVFVRLPSPAQAGKTYTVAFPGTEVAPATLTFDERASFSPAVHVNQVGFRPADPLKVGELSAWTGAGGGITFDPPPSFVVVDTTNGKPVADGTAKRREIPANGEAGKGDLTGAPVYELDFSSLTATGTYRLCVAAIGCSYPFAIDDQSTWMRTTVDVARSMYHQRSGIELGPPYTSVVRPRPYKPSDNTVVVRQSNATLLEVGGPSGENRFKMLAAKGTDTVVPEAWGGHFDAGDWDRHIDHLLYLRSAIDLVAEYPARYEHLDLQIPESTNTIPDVIDEGLWDLDLFQRLQLPDGAIRGGIEASEHPIDRGTSWTETQKVWVYAPDPRSSYVYAGVAAQAAGAIKRYDAARADAYAASARKAYEWAQAHQGAVPNDDAKADVANQQMVAAAALFALTGEAAFQEAFVSLSPFAQGPQDFLGCNDRGLCDAAWIYARTDQPSVRHDVRANVIESFKRNADHLVEIANSTAFGWTLEHPQVPLIWGLGPATPKALGLLRAYVLLHDETYRRAALRSAGFSLGDNPLNTSMLTGLGSRNVLHPLIVDVTNGGLPLWPGTPVYGQHMLGDGDGWVTQYFLAPAGTTPSPDKLPYLWSWFDLPNVAMFNEYTVYQSHATALFTFGVLAAANGATQ